jgi:Asp-tRNA(Asn)/Glu-tRNA(Gln) amidotransferase A subunit family amidase
MCVMRIAKHDPIVRAWVKARPDREHLPGPLAGIPFGCKDIIETSGLPTEYGSPVYKGRLGTSDAAIVRLLRGRGARLMGKTQTTAFAWKTPSPTRNPNHPDHTPGGSSSGSAAAVAAGMVPFAIGTQTLGSVIRPASFCGVTGFKPSYGVLPMDGVSAFLLYHRFMTARPSRLWLPKQPAQSRRTKPTIRARSRRNGTGIGRRITSFAPRSTRTSSRTSL